MEKNLEGHFFHSLNEGCCFSLSWQPHNLDFSLSKAFSGLSLSEPRFRAVNITLNPAWEKERSFWWQLLITAKKRIKLHMERNTSMLQVQQSVWKGILRGEGRGKDFMDVALWPRICLEKKGQMQLGLHERILTTSVTSLKFWISVDGLNSYQVGWCCQSEYTRGISSFWRGHRTN